MLYDDLGESMRTPDHPELCLAWEQGVNLWAEEAFRRMNTDESKVRNYELPPLPDTLEEWEKQRPEVLQQFEECMYGQVPPPPDMLELKLLAENPEALGGLAIRREYRVFCRMNNGRSFDFDMMLYVPKNAKIPPPTFIILNFMGNQTGPDPDIRPTRAPGDTLPNRWHTVGVNAQARNTMVDCFSAAVKRGYAIATACYGEIFPDNLDGFRKSIFRLFHDDLRPDCEVSLTEVKAGHRRTIGAISAWAWGYSRIADALETIDLVDASKLAIVGHSRLGKAALWAGANDTRFKLVASNNSGNGGAALSRRNFGETLSMLWMIRSNWFCDRMVRYAGYEDELPIDQHQLLALIAPRALCVASSSRDVTADPRGEFLATLNASKAWRLYGFEGLQVEEMPPENKVVGDQVRYFVKTGKHSLTLYDLEQYFNFADDLFGVLTEK